MKAFFEGAKYPFRALSFIAAHPELFRYIVFPLLINFLIFSAGFFWFIYKLDALLSFIPRQEGWFYGVLYYGLAFFLIIIFLLLAFYLFTVIGNLIASPFNAALSEKTEHILGIHLTGSTGLKTVFKDIAHSVATEIKRLLFFLIWFLFILIFNLIPGIGQAVYVLLMFFFTCYALTFTYMDYSLDRRYRSFRKKNKIIFSDKSRMIGFGMVCIVLGMIPVINFFLIPVLVVAGTLMTMDVLKKIQT